MFNVVIEYIWENASPPGGITISKSPLPKIDSPLIVLIFVPETNVACLEFICVWPLLVKSKKLAVLKLAKALVI